MGRKPLAYLISFRTYGTWLHGDDRGSVDREHNTPGTPYLPANLDRERSARQRMRRQPVTLTKDQRVVVDKTIKEVCAYRGWFLHEMNIRTQHIHMVVTSDRPPEPTMLSLKSWCTRRLREAGLVARDVTPWSRHGSTLYLWTDKSFARARRYVR